MTILLKNTILKPKDILNYEKDEFVSCLISRDKDGCFELPINRDNVLTYLNGNKELELENYKEFAKDHSIRYVDLKEGDIKKYSIEILQKVASKQYTPTDFLKLLQSDEGYTASLLLGAKTKEGTYLISGQLRVALLDYLFSKVSNYILTDLCALNKKQKSELCQKLVNYVSFQLDKKIEGSPKDYQDIIGNLPWWKPETMSLESINSKYILIFFKDLCQDFYDNETFYTQVKLYCENLKTNRSEDNLLAEMFDKLPAHYQIALIDDGLINLDWLAKKVVEGKDTWTKETNLILLNFFSIQKDPSEILKRSN